MEFLSSITSGIVKESIQNYIIDPITKQVSYAFKSDAHLKKLQEEATQLKNESDRYQHAVEVAQRQGREIYPNVNNWLTKADAAIQEAQLLIDGEESKEKKRCFIGLCPDLKTRYQVSKKACKKGLAINELRNEEGLEPASYTPPPQQMVAPSVYTREALPSRVSILNEVMDALKDPNLNMIGVFGMGGVGKTTLAKEVQGRAKADKLFDSIIFVVVSLTPEIKRIQQEVAEVLGLSLKAEGTLLRANELCERLKKEKKVLLILDDMWSPLELHTVGIPFGDDHKGCKIFVTSRSRDVCSDTGAQNIFPINFLSEEDAWRLFKTILPQVEDNEFHAIAKEISKKCAGLPLLIQLVAKDLKKRKELHAWETKLNQLSHFDDLDVKVSSVLRSSYDNLEDDETKAFFLLCGLFGQSNILIEYIVRYTVSLKVFKRSTTIRDTRNKILTFIDILKAESLLLDGDMVGFVKMHDLVRDTARLIFSEVQHAFIGMAGAELNEWPDKDCTRISLPYCKINGDLKSFDCPKTELLLLSTEDPSLKIPDSFFERIRKLAVLDISGLRFVSLPSSLAFLKNLHTLCLHKCQLDEIAIIGELKQLWVLSLVESEIDELPKEMEQLTQLKILDLTDCSELEFIPANMLSKLSLLEELYIKNCFILEGAEGEETLNELSGLSHLTSLEIHVGDGMVIPEALSNQLRRYKILIGSSWNWYQEFEDSSKMLKLCTSIHLEHGVTLLLKKAEEVHLKEMKGMKNVLHELDRDGFPHMKHLSISSSHDLRCIINSTTKLVFPKLESLYIEDMKHMENVCHDRLADGSFKKLRILKIDDCPTLAHLFSVSVAKSFLQLEELRVSRCVNIEKVIIRECKEENEVVEFTRLRYLTLEYIPQLKSFCYDKEEYAADVSSSLFNKMVNFPNLESLILKDLKMLNNIWHNEMTDNSFWKLKKFEVRGCGRLSRIFSSHVIQRFQDLQELIVQRSDLVEEISEIEERNNEVVEFTQLRSLRLCDLPCLKSFCSTKEDSTTLLFNSMVAFPNLESLELKGLKILNNILHNEMPDNWKLKKLIIEDCGRLSRIFPSHVIQRFHNLQELRVEGCDLVEEIYEIEERNNEVVEFTQLRSLELRKLPCLKSFCNTKEDSTTSLFSSMVAFPNLESLKLKGLKILNDIFHNEIPGNWKLKKLIVEDCGRLSKIFPSHVIQRFHNLQELRVEECDLVEEIYEIEERNNEVVEFTQLRYLRLCDLPCLKSFCDTKEDSTTSLFNSMVAFPNLESLDIIKCKRLSRIFQSYVIERFQKLKKLMVRSCDLVEEIYEIDERHHGSDATTISFDLRDLRFIYLKSLKKIWSKDPKGVFTFQNLQSVDVIRCDCLKYIFPVCIAARDLSRLEKLEISQSSVEEVVEKAKEGGEEGPYFNFPKLSRFSLDYLYEITSFYPGRHAIKLPILKDISVRRCPKVVAFGLSNVKLQSQPLFFVDKVNMPSLEHMELGNNELMAFSCVEFPIEHFSKTKTICVSDIDDESQHLLCGFLVRLCSLSVQTLTIQKCHLNEGLFSNDISVMPVKELILGYCDHLKHIWQLKPLDKHLQSLEIYACNSLANKAPSSSSFENLAILRVSFCLELRDLITTSTAKAMVQLKEIGVFHCYEMTEIVANDTEEKDTIIFSKLTSLKLYDLPKLTCFCSANHSFNFPCLKEVWVRRCSQMKIFCPGDVSTLKLRKIKEFDKSIHLKGSINATVASINRSE